jgi:hypothetical protein
MINDMSPFGIFVARSLLSEFAEKMEEKKINLIAEVNFERNISRGNKT